MNVSFTKHTLTYSSHQSKACTYHYLFLITIFFFYLMKYKIHIIGNIYSLSSWIKQYILLCFIYKSHCKWRHVILQWICILHKSQLISQAIWIVQVVCILCVHDFCFPYSSNFHFSKLISNSFLSHERDTIINWHRKILLIIEFIKSKINRK